MRAKSTLAAVGLIGVGLIAAGFTRARQTEGGIDMAKAMEMMKLAQPGEAHKVLRGLEGEWERSITMSMMPGAPPMELTGSSTNEMILGGRFLQVETRSRMMGQPYEELLLMGFDRRSEVYTLVSFTTSGTYYVTAEGRRDAETGVISLRSVDEIEGMGRQVFRMDIEVTDPDRYVTTVFALETGGQVLEEPRQVMQIVATRKP